MRAVREVDLGLTFSTSCVLTALPETPAVAAVKSDSLRALEKASHNIAFVFGVRNADGVGVRNEVMRRDRGASAAGEWTAATELASSSWETSALE